MRRWSFQGNILVSNFSDKTTPSAIAELFDDYGLVLGVEIKEVVSNAGTRVIAIVALAPETAVDKAIEGLQGHSLDGRKIKLKRSVQKEKSADVKPAVSVARSHTSLPPAPVQESPPTIRRKVVVEYRAAPRVLRPSTVRSRSDGVQDA